MITFKSKYIEEKVREKLKIEESALTSEDLERITGFLIDENTEFSVPIVWSMDSSAYKMTLPNLHLNYSEMIKAEGWEDDLRLFSHIQALYCFAQIPLDVIKCYTELIDLTLYKVEISDWSFLAGLNDLRMIFLYKCGDGGNEAIKHICKLQYEQASFFRRTRVEDPHKSLSCNVLEYIAVIKMNINDLTPFRKARLIELDLSWNAIKDISPLSETTAYSISLRHNEIEDIKGLIFGSFMLNLRHNKIKTISPIIERKSRLPLHLYLDHNDFPEKEREGFNKNDFIGEDFIRNNMREI